MRSMAGVQQLRARAFGLIAILAAASPSVGCAPATAPPPQEEETLPREPTGRRAPQFARPAVPSGEPIAIVPGKVNVLMFWATWHEPSKKAMPKLSELHAATASQGVVVIGISIDEADSAASIAEATTWGARFPLVWDEGHRIARRWGVSTVSAIYVVDRGGVIRHVFAAYRPDTDAALERVVRGLL